MRRLCAQRPPHSPRRALSLHEPVPLDDGPRDAASALLETEAALRRHEQEPRLRVRASALPREPERALRKKLVNSTSSRLTLHHLDLLQLQQHLSCIWSPCRRLPPEESGGEHAKLEGVLGSQHTRGPPTWGAHTLGAHTRGTHLEQVGHTLRVRARLAHHGPAFGTRGTHSGRALEARACGILAAHALAAHAQAAHTHSGLARSGHASGAHHWPMLGPEPAGTLLLCHKERRLGEASSNS